MDSDRLCLNPNQLLRIFYYISVILHTEPVCPITHYNRGLGNNVLGYPKLVWNCARYNRLAGWGRGIRFFGMPVFWRTHYIFSSHTIPLFYYYSSLFLYIYSKRKKRLRFTSFTIMRSCSYPAVFHHNIVCRERPDVNIRFLQLPVMQEIDFRGPDCGKLAILFFLRYTRVCLKIAPV